MNKKCVWYWITYAIPGLIPLGWFAMGHEPGNQLRLLVWAYGFPSTALVLPVISLWWNLDSSTEFVVTTVTAMLVNGATCSYILHLLRNSSRPETPVTNAIKKQA